MATEILGSADEVRELLKCSSADFQKYRDGRKEPPWPEIDRLVALLVREYGAKLDKNREFLDEMRKRRLRR